MTREKQINTIVQRIADIAHPEKIILFGSRASETARKDSDVDLLIVEREPFGKNRSRLEEMHRLEKAIGSIPLSTDLLVYSRDEFERYSKSINHIVAHAVQEGIVIYERS